MGEKDGGLGQPSAPESIERPGTPRVPESVDGRETGFPAGMTPKTAWITLGVLVLGQMASALNQTTMTSCLAVIMHEFGISANLGQWLTTAYMLCLGITMPLTAHLMTKHRARSLFEVALGVFLAGAVLGAVQHNFWVLVAARCIQACGSGIVIPLVQVVAFRIFPYHRRGEATGVAAMAVALAPAFGPVLAGLLTDTIGWRSIFAVTGGMAAISMAVAWHLLRRLPEHVQPSRLDGVSFALSSLTAVGIVVGCSDMGTFGVASPFALVPLALGLVALAVFVARQLRVPEPLLDIRTFRCAPFALACFSVMLIQGTVVAINNFTCLYVQDVQQRSATLAGLTMLPGALAMMAIAPLAGRILDHHGPRHISAVGFALLLGGTFLLSTLTPQSPLWMPMAFQTLRYAGVACLNQMLLTWGINQLGSQAGFTQGTAAANTVRQVGAAATNALLFSAMDLQIARVGEACALTNTYLAMVVLQAAIAAAVLGYMTLVWKNQARRASE